MGGTRLTNHLTIHKGLEGVVVTDTQLSLVDGEKGHLIYRGFWAKELALKYTYEHVAYLLWHGRLPSDEELRTFREQMADARVLPDYLKAIIDRIPANVDMMSVLRTAVSALGDDTYGWPPTVEQAMAVTAKVPTIIAYRYRRANGQEPLEPRRDLSHTANYLYMLFGKEPPAAHVSALDAYLILTAEHGMNASTFSARVTTSTRSDLISAVTSAIGTMKGPLHGGAPSEVDETLIAIGTKENAEPYLRSLLERGERIMGFGHRVYKTRDPRAEALSVVAKRVAGDDPWLDLAVHVEEVAIKLLAEYKPGRNLYTNVEFYAAAVLRAVGLPKELYTPTFTLSRMAGWTAHVLEQAADNRLIRPQSVYTGPMPEGEA